MDELVSKVRSGLYYFPSALKGTYGTFKNYATHMKPKILKNEDLFGQVVHMFMKLIFYRKKCFCAMIFLVSSGSIDPRCRLVRGQTATVIVVS